MEFDYIFMIALAVGIIAGAASTWLLMASKVAKTLDDAWEDATDEGRRLIARIKNLL